MNLRYDKMNPQQYPPQYPQQPGQPGPGLPPQPQIPAQPGVYPTGPMGPTGPVGSPYGPPAQQPYPPVGAQPAPQPDMTLGYNPYPYPGEYDKKPAAKKGVTVAVVIGVVMLLAAAVGVMILTAGSGKKVTPAKANQQSANQQTTSNAGNDTLPRPDGTLDLSQKISPSKTLKAQTLQAKQKEQVNLSSGFSFMVNGLEPYTSPNNTTKPGDGKKFVVATVVVGNRIQGGNISVSYLDFRLRDKDNTLIPGHVATNEILDNSLSSPSELKPGQQINGKIVFEVDANDSAWVFRHNETYQKTTDNTTFDVSGEIVASLADDTTKTNTPVTGSNGSASGSGSSPAATTPATTTGQ